MIRKLACAMAVMVVAVGFVVAEEFGATINSVDTGKKTVTYQKYKKGVKGKQGEKDGDAVTISVAADAKIAKGVFDKDTKKWSAGDAIEGGLQNEVFKLVGKASIAVRIMTDDDNKSIIRILALKPGAKK